MSTSTFEENFKQEVITRYCEKYGDVQIRFDVIQMIDTQTAKVQFTISDDHGFITRYYGMATYQSTKLQMSVKSI